MTQEELLKSAEQEELEEIRVLQIKFAEAMRPLFGDYGIDAGKIYFRDRDYDQNKIAEILGISSGQISRLLRNPNFKDGQQPKKKAYLAAIREVEAIDRYANKFRAELEETRKSITILETKVEAIQNPSKFVRAFNTANQIGRVFLKAALVFAMFSFGIFCFHLDNSVKTQIDALSEDAITFSKNLNQAAGKMRNQQLEIGPSLEARLRTGKSFLTDEEQIEYILVPHQEEMTAIYIKAAKNFNKRMKEEHSVEFEPNFPTNAQEISLRNEFRRIIYNLTEKQRKFVGKPKFLTPSGASLVDVMNCAWSYEQVIYPMIDEILPLLLDRSENSSNIEGKIRNSSEFGQNKHWNQLIEIAFSKEQYELQCG